MWICLIVARHVNQRNEDINRVIRHMNYAIRRFARVCNDSLIANVTGIDDLGGNGTFVEVSTTRSYAAGWIYISVVFEIARSRTVNFRILYNDSLSISAQPIMIE